jgi:oligoribonuclease
MLAYLQRFVRKDRGLLAGHCVYVDREFIRLELPRVFDWLNFRIIGIRVFFCFTNVDVSTIRFLSQSWVPGVANAAPKRKKDHRAMEDVKETVVQLRYYQESLWRSVDQV